MRKIDHYSEGKIVETFFVFETEEERSEFFLQAETNINESQAKSLSDLRSAYMSNSVKARRVRSVKGRDGAKEIFDGINKKYAEQVKKTHDLYAKSRGNLRAARESSLLESDLQRVEIPASPG
jgi:hypothetical protein